MSSDVSASTDSNTYYEDDFSSTEDSSQGECLEGGRLMLASLGHGILDSGVGTTEKPRGVGS